MQRPLIRGVKRYFEPKTGKIYAYHRKSGRRLNAPYGSAEFFTELAAAEAAVKPKPIARPGSLGAVIALYRASHQFQSLKPRTRSDYEKVLNYLKDCDELPLHAVAPKHIVDIRDHALKIKKRSFANYVLAVLSILFAFAVERGICESNPVRLVRKVRRREGEERGNRPWTKEEWSSVIAAAPSHLALPLSVGRWTGLREGDVLRMPVTAYDGNVIRLKTSKRGVVVSLPVVAPLKELLDRRQAHSAVTLCVNSRGRPWTESGFRASLFKFLGRLVKSNCIEPGLTFHGLRHTVATELRELGYDNRTIADMLGQKTEAMAAHYSREADLASKLQKVADARDEAIASGARGLKKSR